MIDFRIDTLADYFQWYGLTIIFAGLIGASILAVHSLLRIVRSGGRLRGRRVAVAALALCVVWVAVLEVRLAPWP